jgi:phosphate acetyltransferase
MPILEQIKSGSEHEPKILLGDSTDERILRAASICREQKIAHIEFIGDPELIAKAAEQYGIHLEGWYIWSQKTFGGIENFIKEYYETRKTKVPDYETAHAEVMHDDLLFGALLVHHGMADGIIAGSLSTSAHVIRSAIRGIGLAPGIRSLSSMFLLNFGNSNENRAGGLRVRPTAQNLAFADCAVIEDPDAHQLADIAISTAATYKKLTGNIPVVAMLSYSTKGSASSDSTKKMILATEIVKEREPGLIIDGELQFDAAFIPTVAERKAPESLVKGEANVFILPNLDAGNIGYKIAERLGGAQAIGPILQGLNNPMNDLSRGASIDDIVTMIRVTALQSAQSA